LHVIKDARGISNVLVVMLSLILIVVIVSNVVYWGFQMNEADWERAQESFTIVDVRDHWDYFPSKISLLQSTSLVSGSLSDIEENDGSYMVFRSFGTAPSSQSLFAHSESLLIGGAISNVYRLYGADGPASTLSVSMGVSGRSLLGRFVYPLSGVRLIPSSTWTFYYRAWRSSVSSNVQTSILRPNGPGTYTEWTTVYPSDIPHWEAVNDVDADGDSSYVETSTQNLRDTYALNDLPASGIVNRVKVYAVARRLSTGASFRIMIRTHGNDYFSGSFTPASSYAYYSYSWDRNPYTNDVWTFNEVNSLEVGVQCTGTRGVRVTQVYVEVDWVSQSVEGHVDVDILIRRSDGTIREVFATDAANSAPLTETPQTLTGTYLWRDYQVADQSDYLEIVYYCHVTVENSNVMAYLRIDDDSLGEAYQTRIANVMLPSQQTLQIEFEGQSNTYNWSRLIWMFDGAFTTSNVAVTLQLYNYSAGEYPASGEGYISYTSGEANMDESLNQTINNPEFFHDAAGNWRIKIVAAKGESTPFECKVDMLKIKPYIKGTLLTVKNKCSSTIHIVSLWIINSTKHQHYDINAFINPAESSSLIFPEICLPKGNCTVKIVTERGNIATYSIESED
jgi:hypothetical protein